MNKGDLKIARTILRAQTSSDSGKGDHWIATKYSGLKNANRYGYNNKPMYIEKAIRAILTTKKTSNWRFYVCERKDQNGYDSILVYFRYNDGIINKQVSFHNPTWCENLHRYIDSSDHHKIDWDHGNSEKSIREIIRHLRKGEC